MKRKGGEERERENKEGKRKENYEGKVNGRQGLEEMTQNERIRKANKEGDVNLIKRRQGKGKQ